MQNTRHGPSQSGGYSSRYSAKNMAKPVNFYCRAPQAKEVSLIGDFNQWQAAAHPMVKQPDGSWYIQANLPHGHHHYQFLVDGVPCLDPRAQGTARDEHHGRVALIAVS